MKRAQPDLLALLDSSHSRTPNEDRALADACRRALTGYRAAVAAGVGAAAQSAKAAARRPKAARKLKAAARRALLHLGGDPARSSASLKDYDHLRYGPFLGVSDEGSAAAAIRDAAYASPKVRALPRTIAPTPLIVGMAVDAERLGGIGEVVVGPEEYADIWLECVARLLITTNIGTRVNVRVYRREPLVIVESLRPAALAQAKAHIAAAFQPFVETPDKKPRPLTVFVDIPNYIKATPARKKAALKKLVAFVASGRAANRKKRPAGQQLGLAAWVKLGPAGQDQVLAAIDLAASVGINTVIVDGVKRKDADRAVSFAGLLEYFPPGLLGPILRHAARRKVAVRTANLPDTDTIARSIWVGLSNARNMGANLGKYGCFPLTRRETDLVVEQIQAWLGTWSAAPVFFVDHGLLDEQGVDVGSDLVRGLKKWLQTVAARGVRVVLIDTIDKATGRRLLRTSSHDDTGFLGPHQIEDALKLARKLGVHVLWAGGLVLRDTYEMGKRGVFGVYVTSAAATTIPVGGTYVRDPSLAGVKEPSKEAVLRTKVLLEAGFLSARLTNGAAARIEELAQLLLAAHDAKDAATVKRLSRTLASACVRGWRDYWRQTHG